MFEQICQKLNLTTQKINEFQTMITFPTNQYRLIAHTHPTICGDSLITSVILTDRGFLLHKLSYFHKFSTFDEFENYLLDVKIEK